MSANKGFTDAQTRFLRALRRLPGPADTKNWPTGPSLRDWLRSKTFRRRYKALVKSLRDLVGLALLNRAATAARALETAAAPDEQRRCTDAIRLWLQYLHRTSPRRRTRSAPTTAPETLEEAALRLKHPSAPPDEAIAFFRELQQQMESDLAARNNGLRTTDH